MKQTGRKKVGANSEKAMKQVQKIFHERGSKALEMARKEILKEKVECKEAREALNYFMTEYWHDLARPALLSLVCEAVGGNPDATTPIAVPMILISGAIDVHDDIIDQSKTKDYRPTVYGKYGKDIALLIGDALLFKGLTLLNEAIDKGVPAERMKMIINVIKDRFFELGDAEALELQFLNRLDVTPKEYLDVVRKKAADVEAHTRIGAILGGGSKREIEALGEYGRLLGMLIILRDDWIDMINPGEAKNRIKNECLPIPILFSLRKPEIKSKIGLILRKETLEKKDIESVLKIVYDAEGIKQLQRLISRIALNAKSKLACIKDDTKHLRTLLLAMLQPIAQTV